MKQKTIALLGILLLVCMIMNVALAESWTCPECGAENTGNFCSNCGAERPETEAEAEEETEEVTQEEESTTITNVTFTYQSNGDVLVEWEDSSSASSYDVEYTSENWDTNIEFSDIPVKQTTLQFLVPGLTYQITISNGET